MNKTKDKEEQKTLVSDESEERIVESSDSEESETEL